MWRAFQIEANMIADPIMSKPWLPFKRGSTASSQYNVYEDVVDEDRCKMSFWIMLFIIV